MQGKLPAVMYGGTEAPISLTVSPLDLETILRGEYRRNALIKLSVEGADQLVMVKDLAVDPVKRNPVHADFLRVTADSLVFANIPLLTEGRAEGVKAGGKLTVAYREVSIRTTPSKIPAHITVDVTALNLDDAVTAGDLPVGEGVEVLLPADRKVIVVEEDRRAALAAEAEATEAAEG
jgi:large subunit ribosomal protein L25